jgi:hypothetical protein
MPMPIRAKAGPLVESVGAEAVAAVEVEHAIGLDHLAIEEDAVIEIDVDQGQDHLEAVIVAAAVAEIVIETVEEVDHPVIDVTVIDRGHVIPDADVVVLLALLEVVLVLVDGGAATQQQRWRLQWPILPLGWLRCFLICYLVG